MRELVDAVLDEVEGGSWEGVLYDRGVDAFADVGVTDELFLNMWVDFVEALRTLDRAYGELPQARPPVVWHPAQRIARPVEDFNT